MDRYNFPQLRRREYNNSFFPSFNCLIFRLCHTIIPNTKRRLVQLFYLKLKLKRTALSAQIIVFKGEFGLTVEFMVLEIDRILDQL